MNNSILTVCVAIIAFIITAALGYVFIPMLKKLKFGQTIRDDGPTWHAAKEGTPTIGGIMFIVGIIVAFMVGFMPLLANNENVIASSEVIRTIASLIMALAFGLIGFCDDYIKVVKKRNLGLTFMQKVIMQVIVTVTYLIVLSLNDPSTLMRVPFFGLVDFGILYYPILAILIIGIVNSANLTDGIDGLCTTVTFVMGIFFMLATAMLRIFSGNILATALTAACLGFLVWNIHPAKVFMGDTGSMFLGGMVVALAFCIDMPLLLFLVGFIYCVESLSVILQVISFKTTGKRIFKMSPIHHHFEMSGYSEEKIVRLFFIVTVITCAVALISIVLI